MSPERGTPSTQCQVIVTSLLAEARSTTKEAFMTKLTSSLAIMAALSGACLAAAPAQAQLSRTFVSAATGNDGNNCDRPTPCRTFQVAHDKTNSNGEITVLDSGGYGAVTITKSISIVNDGVGEAGVLVSGGATGITVNAGAAGYVNLHGLTIQGIGFGGGTGLRFVSGFSLTINDCTIRNHTGNGIELAPTEGKANVSVLNTLVADNGGHGITADTGRLGTAVLNLVLSRVAALNNSQNGVFLTGQTDATSKINASVLDSVAANNIGVGFSVSTGRDTAASLMVLRSLAANNHVGLNADDFTPGGALIRVGQSTITGNDVAYSGNVSSYGDNNIDANGIFQPAPHLIAKQ
jgi:hypothetical protein